MAFRLWGMMRGLRFMLGTRLAIGARGKRRVAAIGAAAVMAAGLATAVAQVAGAQPQPSISDVQAKINTLSGEFDKAHTQQYDQVAQQLTAAKARLKQVNRQLARDKAQVRGVAEAGRADRRLLLRGLKFDLPGRAAHREGPEQGAHPGVDPAAAHRERGTSRRRRSSPTPPSSCPCSRSSSARRRASSSSPGSASHTKDHIAKLLSDQKNILSTLTAAQVTQVQQGTVTSGGGNTHAHYTGPTSDPGGEGGGLRLRTARLPLQLRPRRDRAVSASTAPAW